MIISKIADLHWFNVKAAIPDVYVNVFCFHAWTEIKNCWHYVLFLSCLVAKLEIPSELFHQEQQNGVLLLSSSSDFFFFVWSVESGSIHITECHSCWFLSFVRRQCQVGSIIVNYGHFGGIIYFSVCNLTVQLSSRYWKNVFLKLLESLAKIY